MNVWKQLLCSLGFHKWGNLGFHKWGKWQFTNERKYFQYHICERCGIYKTRLAT